mgnify:CR=1 FL=1
MNKKMLIGIVVLVLVIIVGIIFMVIHSEAKQESSANEKNAKDVLDSSKHNSENKTESTDTNNNKTSGGKTLVAYFSMAGDVYNVGKVEIGNTALMASYIVDYLNADSFEIVPVKTYPSNHSDLIADAKEEQQRDDRPEIKNKLNNMDEYDTVFIGYPIWWGDLPQILYTFLEEYNFDGKTVIPFNTHEGSGSAGTYNTVKSKLSNANVNTNGLSIQGKVARTDEGKEKTIDWLKELGY